MFTEPFNVDTGTMMTLCRNEITDSTFCCRYRGGIGCDCNSGEITLGPIVVFGEIIATTMAGVSTQILAATSSISLAIAGIADVVVTSSSTAETAYPTSSESGGTSASSSSGSSSSGSHVNWEAFGAAIAIVGVLSTIYLAWWTNRKNRWAIHAIERLVGHHSSTQLPQARNHRQHRYELSAERTARG